MQGFGRLGDYRRLAGGIIARVGAIGLMKGATCRRCGDVSWRSSRAIDHQLRGSHLPLSITAQRKVRATLPRRVSASKEKMAKLVKEAKGHEQ